MKFGEKGGNDDRKNLFKVGRDPDSNPDPKSGLIFRINYRSDFDSGKI